MLSAKRIFFVPAKAIIRNKRCLSIASNSTHPLYSHAQVSKSIWWITEKFFDSWNLANIYFVKGSNADLLIDAGIGVHDLTAFLKWAKIRESREKPLKIALTHTHFDHSGGVHRLVHENPETDVYVHKSEAQVLESGSKFWSAAWVTPNEVLPKPDHFNASEYNVLPVKNLHHYDEGDILDLGDKSCQIFHLPGHSVGSVGIYVKEEGALATGDTVYATDHELIDWYPGSSSHKMANSVEKILNFTREANVDLALPGHNAVLSGEELQISCEKHLRAHTIGRRIRKGLVSRPRANLVLWLNSRGMAGNIMRNWIMN